MSDIEDVEVAVAAKQVREPPLDDAATKLSVRISKRLGAMLAPPDGSQADLRALVQHSAMIREVLQGAFWSPATGRMFFMNDDSDLVSFTGAMANKFLRRRFGEPMDYELLRPLVEVWAGGDDDAAAQKKKKAKLEECRKVPWQMLIDELMFTNQRDATQVRVDMFATQGRMEMTKDTARIIYPHQPLPTAPFNPDIVDDFREHFPQLDDFLTWVVASRFAKDRKKAFLWLKAPSDWGKGFLMSALGELGLVAQVSVKEVEGLFEGRPAGLSPADFKRAFVLFVDEFKTVRSELKQLQNDISLSPKHQLRANVEVFAKVFASAEDVPALVSDGVIEDQFARRFNYIEGAGSLDARSLRREVGARAYITAIKHYAAARINEQVAGYVAQWREGAALSAEAVLEAFYAEHRITQAYAPISSELDALASDFMAWLIKMRREVAVGARGGDVADRVKSSLIEHEGGWYLQRGTTLVGNWIDATMDKSAVMTYKRKAGEILEKLGGDEVTKAKTYRLQDVNGVVGVRKALKLVLEDSELASLSKV